MSVKDVKDYYDEVCQLRSDFIAELKDFEELANNNMFPPERLDGIKESIQPLMRNYEMLSYVMFLLSKRKNGRATHRLYERSNGKTKENAIQECNDSIDAVKKLKESFKEECEMNTN